MIVETDYGRGGAGSLTAYMQRDKEKEQAKRRVPLRDHTGREISKQERERFVERSRNHNFHRQHIISPDPDLKLTRKELHRGVQRTMSKFQKERTATYVYAVHHSGGARPHAHVAITGPERELRLDEADLKRHNEQAREAFRERERLQTRTRTRTRTRRKDRERERELLRDHALAPTRGVDQGAQQGPGGE